MEHYNDITRGVVDPFMRIGNKRWGSDLCDVPRMFVVMRGLPGSGKTTLAETIVEYAGEMAVYCMICSANDFFMQNGVFQFNADDIGRAHDAGFNRCLAGLSQARDQGPDIIIVDNTESSF
jgi:signal recognition particle GTPase